MQARKGAGRDASQTGCTTKIYRIRVVGIFRAAGGPGWPTHAEGACEFESRMRGCVKTHTTHTGTCASAGLVSPNNNPTRRP